MIRNIRGKKKKHTDSDEQLIATAKRDRRAFSVLYEKYYEQIFLFIFKRVETEALAADLCSQVFLQAMNRLPQFEYRGHPFSSWLYRIAINEVNGYFRKNKRAVRVVSMDRVNAERISDESGMDVELEEMLSAMESVLGELDEPSLCLIEMRFFDQKSFKEMGAILGITEGNAKVKTYRVLEKLKKRLTKS